MQAIGDKRAYVRDTDFYTEAEVSRDEKFWQKITVTDLAAGGLKFHADESDFKIGEVLWFELTIRNFGGLHDPKLHTQGIIKRIFHVKEGQEYGVAFKDINAHMSIHIDEIIQRLNHPHHEHEHHAHHGHSHLVD